jgi:MFS family permease
VSDRTLRTRRIAVTAVFVVLGGAEGTWAARIPAIKSGLHLSPGLLGLALLGPAVGCVLAMPATGAILASVAPRRVTQFGVVLLAAMLPVTTVAGSAWQLFLVLAGWGAGIGTVDVSMNTEGAVVQDQLGRRVMSSFHGAYSVGGLIGAGLGAIAAGTGLSVRATFVIASIVMLVIGTGGAQAFAARPAHHAAGRPDGAAAPRDRRARWPRWSWTLAALGAISFASFLAEGSATNWSAVYLHSSLGASPAVAAIGFTVFACTMTAGRLGGDWLADRAGPVRLVRLSAGVATIGFGAALIISQVWAGLAGWAVLGGGLSVVVPLAFTGAAALGRPGPNLAMVTSCGYLGALAGPAIIGGLAELTSLPAALGTVVALSGMIVLLAGAVRPRRLPPADAAASPAGGAATAGPEGTAGPADPGGSGTAGAGTAGAGTAGRAGPGATDPGVR